MCSRVLSAWAWNWLTIAAQAAGVLGVGVEPPPDNTDPRFHWAITVGSGATAARSAWVICPIFSASVMRPSRSATRRSIGTRASRYGRGAGRDTGGAVGGTDH